MNSKGWFFVDDMGGGGWYLDLDEITLCITSDEDLDEACLTYFDGPDTGIVISWEIL